MKFQCPECGEIIYTREEITSCPGCCNSRLEDRTPGAKEVECPVSGSSVRRVNEIPDCNHFKLTNAVGSRCTFGEFPSECRACGLPFYNPRVGLSGD